MTVLDSVQQTIRANQPLLAKQFFVRRLGVFGSVARNLQNDASDIDMLVEFTQPVSMFQFLTLEQKLADLLGRKIDLVTPDALKSAIKETVLRETIYV